MINVELKKASSAFSLTVSGHAGFSCKGRDIVCAGVSSLCQAFLSSVKALAERGDFGGFSFEISDGFLAVRAENYKTERVMLLMTAYIYMFCKGISAIADSYGKYVKLVLCSESPQEEFTDIDTPEQTVNVKGR